MAKSKSCAHGKVKRGPRKGRCRVAPKGKKSSSGSSALTPYIAAGLAFMLL